MARQENRRRTRLVRPYPADTLEEAQEVAKAIGASGATESESSLERLRLASVMGTTAKSSAFVTVLNSSAKYGLTQGGYRDERIRLTARGLSIVAPTRERERMHALTDAALEPEVFSQFYEAHNGADLPDDTYSKNILQRELRIQAELTSECLEIIKANGVFVGLIKESRGKLKVDMGLNTPHTSQLAAPIESAPNGAANDSGASEGRVFVGHWGDPDAARFVTKTLADFHIPYAYLEELEPDGRPVNARIAEEMHKSAAAILVFAESDGSEDGQRHREQMLYLLGASSVLFGEKVLVFQCAPENPEGKYDTGLTKTRAVVFRHGKYEEAGLELIRELFQSGIIRVSV